MSKRLYSVLIPVYNVEPYLRECLDSVLSQTVQNFEIILVNDGSTDKSGEICDEYAEKDERIRVFHRENAGLLQTRRFSIKKAVGDWFLFLDSDDFWDKDLIRLVDSTIEEFDADMVFYRYRRVEDNGLPYDEGNNSLESAFDDKTVFTAENHEMFFMAMFVKRRFNNIYSKAFRRDIMDIDADYSSFSDLGEDLVQSVYPVAAAKKIVYRDKHVYNYRMSKSGMTRNLGSNYIKDYLDLSSYKFTFLRNSPYASKENEKKLFLHEMEHSVLHRCFTICFANISGKEKMALYRQIQNHDFFATIVEEAGICHLPKKYQKIISDLTKGRLIRVRLRCLFYLYGGKYKKGLKSFFEKRKTYV